MSLEFNFVVSSIDQSSETFFLFASQAIEQAHNFLSRTITSSTVSNILEEHKKDIELFEERYYFELITNIPEELNEVQCICAKTFTDNGFCFITIYFEGIFYCIISEMKQDEPLLNVEFPNVFHKGNGIMLGVYDQNEEEDSTMEWRLQWKKLSLWQSMSPSSVNPKHILGLSSDYYIQTYCILKPNKVDHSQRDVLFRFGSWCYNGNVELIDRLRVDDIPYVIPALRIQQQKLAFLCDISDVPEDSFFSEPMIYNSQLINVFESEIISVEGKVESVTRKMDRNSGYDEDPNNFFFEFSSSGDHSVFTNNHIDLIATKSYRPNGLIVMTIYFEGTFYVCVNDGDGDQPLLNSNFPCVVQGNGHELKSYPNGIKLLPNLRKLTLWQNAEAVRDGDRHNEAIVHQDEAKNDSESNSQNESSMIQTDDKPPLSDLQHPSCEAKYVIDDNAKENDIKMIGFESKDETERNTLDMKGLNETQEKQTISTYDTSIKNTQNQMKQNLGAFHHLAPLRKPSALAERIQKIEIRGQGHKDAPFDHQSGQPILK